MSTVAEKYVPRLLTAYRTAVAPEMMKRFGWKNFFQVPRLQKIVLNLGVSEAKENAKVMDLAAEELAAIPAKKRKSAGPKNRSRTSSCAKACPSGCA